MAIFTVSDHAGRRGRLASALIALGLAAAVPSAQTPPIAAAVTAAIDAEATAGFSGAVVVRHEGRELAARGVGAIDGVAMTLDTRFWIASVGKQFSSAAILRAQELGLLRLDAPVADYIEMPADKSAITVRQLVSHTSGLAQGYASESAATGAEAAAAILGVPLEAAPGTRFIYSNENFQLASFVLENVAKEPYERFVKRELWDRAGLTSTGLARVGAMPEVAPAIHPLPPRLLRMRWGQQGYFSTAPDLARWYEALSGATVLSRASVDELFRAVAPIQEGSAALGWFLGKTSAGATRVFTRGNEDFGPNALIYAYPDSRTVIVILSHGGSNGSDVSFSRALVARLEAALFGARP